VDENLKVLIVALARLPHRAGRLSRGAEGLEFDLPIAGSNAKDQSTTANRIKRSCCFGNFNWMVKRKDDDRRTEVEAGAFSGHTGEEMIVAAVHSFDETAYLRSDSMRASRHRCR